MPVPQIGIPDDGAHPKARFDGTQRRSGHSWEAKLQRGTNSQSRSKGPTNILTFLGVKREVRRSSKSVSDLIAKFPELRSISETGMPTTSSFMSILATPSFLAASLLRTAFVLLEYRLCSVGIAVTVLSTKE